MERVTSTKYTIKQIFQDHWDEYLEEHPLVPDYIRENVSKMLNCRNPEKQGYAKVVCPNHPECFTIIPFSCKSRFCNACGKVATDNWLIKATSDFPNVSYSHVTFTVPSELRELFLTKPDTRKILFKIASSIVLDWCRDRGWIPAITCVLHTFGRDLKFHPHIHMLISTGGLDAETESKWIDCPFLPEGMLKKRWQTLLLYRLCGDGLISVHLKRNLYYTKWYLYIAKQLLIAIVTTNYVGRYTKRPPLAEARILDYNYHNVTFYYEDWANGKCPTRITYNADEFIARLIQHIPPKYFRLIKHYGLLNNRTRGRYLPLLKVMFGAVKQCLEKTTWNVRQKLFRGTDPTLCPKCRSRMIRTEIAFWSKRYNKLWVKAI
jgi:hypothetical protein